MARDVKVTVVEEIYMKEMTPERLRAISETLDILTVIALPIAKALAGAEDMDDEYVEVTIGFKRAQGIEVKVLVDWLESRIMQEDILEWAEKLEKVGENGGG